MYLPKGESVGLVKYLKHLVYFFFFLTFFQNDWIKGSSKICELSVFPLFFQHKLFTSELCI